MHDLDIEMLSHAASVVINETGKCLTFKVGHEKYEMRIVKLLEIVRLNEVTNMTAAANIITHGVVNYKGQIVPAIDFRWEPQFRRQSSGANASILITEVKRSTEIVVVALMVNQVVDLRHRGITGRSAKSVSVRNKTSHKGDNK